MDITIRRIHQQHDNSCTIGVIDVNSHTFFTLEDGYHEPKVPGQTRIPAGEYEIALRKDSPMAKRYRAKFGNDHKGMLWLQNVPNFTYVYIHIGNDEDDTEGCPLIGRVADITEGYVGDSTSAYKEFYPLVMAAFDRGEKVILTIREEFV